MNLSPAHRAALIFLAVAVAAVFAVRLTKLAAPQRKVNKAGSLPYASGEKHGR